MLKDANIMWQGNQMQLHWR